jgi:hypothetical protein
MMDECTDHLNRASGTCVASCAATRSLSSKQAFATGDWTAGTGNGVWGACILATTEVVEKQTCACTYLKCARGFVYHVTRAFQSCPSEAAKHEMEEVTFTPRYT